MEKQSPALVGLFDKILLSLDKEISNLDKTLQDVPPEKRLDFISKTLPLLLRFKDQVCESSLSLYDWGE